MGKVIVMPSASNTHAGSLSSSNSHQALLPQLLKCALAAHGPDRFPVTILVYPTP
jgi:hypothetical protein